MKKIKIIIFFLFILISVQAQKEWKAQWISTQNNQSKTNTWLCYHKTVDLPAIEKEVFADIAVDSKYWLWINGELVVFEGGLKRGPNPSDTYYDHVELTPYLKKGKNTIALLLWYFGKDGFSHNSSGKAALLFDCQANNFSILSDNTWKCGVYDAYQDTEAPFPNSRIPESNIRFDANLALKEWTSKEANPSLPGAFILGSAKMSPWNQLVKRPIPLWKNYGVSDYTEIVKKEGTEADTLYCKIPYNCHITPLLDVEAPAGKTIYMRMDNYQGGGENNVRAEYITCKGKQTYESFGWMNGHQMIYIIPKGITINKLQYRETGYNAEFTGTFTCNDELLNRLREKAARTLYVTMRDTYMDCPDRERSQWWGDEVNEIGETFYALDPKGAKLGLKGILELMGWQKDNGVIFSPCPAGNWRTELPLQMLASVGYYGFRTYYYYSGDSSFIPVIYDRMKRYLHEVWKVDEKGIVIPRSGDWSWGDWGDNIDMDLLSNCWYYLALKGEKDFAHILGKEEDVKMIENLMGTMEKAHNSHFWTGSEYRSPNYKGATDDRGQALCVLAGFASPKQYSKLLKVFKEEYHASPYMEKYVMEALLYMGYPEFALQRTRERFKKMVNDNNCTTLYEGWGIGSEGYGGGSYNHGWSGGSLTCLSQYVAGISPTQPGFREFQIKPLMGDLTNISATVDTQYGLIKLNIVRKGRKHTMEVTVPQGTIAKVIHSNGVTELKAGTHSLTIQI